MSFRPPTPTPRHPAPPRHSDPPNVIPTEGRNPKTPTDKPQKTNPAHPKNPPSRHDTLCPYLASYEKGHK